MIGSSRNINAYSSHTHEHAVTECNHKDHSKKPEGGNKMQAGNPSVQQDGEQESNVKDILLGGLHSFFSKGKSFLGKIWYSDSGNTSLDKTEIAAELENAEIPADLEAVNAGILVTSAVRKDGKEEITQEDEREKRVGNSESTAGGGLEKEESGIRRFLKQFGEAVAKRSRFFSKKEKTDEKASFAERSGDFEAGDNSYLLDSYNKAGQYSTLVNDRNPESNFKVRG